MSELQRTLIAALLAAAWADGAAAQANQPEVIAPGQTVEAILPDGVQYACYAIHTAPGDRVSVSMDSTAFDAALEIARGALCSASALQHENDDFEAGRTGARIDFTAAGGRYLILARAAQPNAAGKFSLKLQGGQAPANEARVASTDPDAERKRIMEREVARREQQLAAAEAERMRQAAETARRNAEFAAWQAEENLRLAEEEAAYERYEESEAQPNMMAGILEGFTRGWTEAQETNAALDAQFDETRAMIARMEAEDRARQARAAEAQAARARTAQANAAAAQARLDAQYAEQRRRELEQRERDRLAANARRSTESAGGTGSWETAGTTSSSNASRGSSAGSSGGSNRTATPEAVIVCTIPGSDGRFRCATPVSGGISGGPRDSLPEYRTPELMVAHFSASCPGARKLRSSTHLVWGCGFGATNNSAQMDRSAGADIQGRNTYYCTPKETGCRRTAP